MSGKPMASDEQMPQAAEGAISRLSQAVTRHPVVAAAIVLALLPIVLPYWALATNVLIFGLFAVAFNLMLGRLGMLSFGHAALFGAGAYGCGMAVVHTGLAWPLALVAGIVLAGLVALVVGLLAVRVRGIAFSFVTLALAQCLYFIVQHAEPWTGGENGLRGVSPRQLRLPGLTIDLQSPATRYVVFLAIVLVALWIVSRILGSPFGSVLEAIREREARAAACGYNTAMTKGIALVLSGSLSGLAGALYALHLGTVPLDSLHYEISGLVVMMALLGGMRTFLGPLVGALVFLVLKDVTTVWTEHWQLVAGGLFIALILAFPDGILGTLKRWIER
jgi:branched-chain amino acid transport system permease protein